jgi:hypothetical protein
MHYLQSPLLAGVAKKAVPGAIFFSIGKKSPRRFFQAISFVAFAGCLAPPFASQGRPARAAFLSQFRQAGKSLANLQRKLFRAICDN